MYLVTVEELGEIMIMVEASSKLRKVADGGESVLEKQVTSGELYPTRNCRFTQKSQLYHRSSLTIDINL